MAENPVGYQQIRSLFHLRVPASSKPAYLASGVNKRIETAEAVRFPPGVAIEDSPVGHLEFGLRNEGINLAIIAAAFDHIEPAEIEKRLASVPTSEYVRRLGYLWEWLRPEHPLTAPRQSAGYIECFPRADYIVAENGVRNPKYRVVDNALGNPDFCPVVRRSEHPGKETLAFLVDKARRFVAADDADYYGRTTNYLYLSETRTSFEIENDIPDSDRMARFMQILRRAGENTPVTEPFLVAIQNAVVKDDLRKEAGYRTRQNWLGGASRQIDFFPPPPSALRSLMRGWEAFANDTNRGVDPLAKIACASFGFVYLHPFMDGNGRIHRFLVHKLLAQSGLVEGNLLIPVSAVILQHLREYADVLECFSRPVTDLWTYQPGEDEPHILNTAHTAAYRFFGGGRETDFLNRMFQIAVEEEIPKELAWLRGYDKACRRVEAEFDLPQQDINTLIRVIHQNDNRLAARRRHRYANVSDAELKRIEMIVAQAFDHHS